MKKVTHQNARTGPIWSGRKFKHVLATSAFAMSLAGAAQAQDTVTLQYDDGYGVTGEILGFEDNVFRIRSSVGVVTIPSDEVTCSGASCPAGTTAESDIGQETALQTETQPSDGDGTGQATITSLDGKVQLIGRIISFTDNEYLIETEIGQVAIDAARVSCEGDGCIENQGETQSESVFSFGGDVILNDGSTSIEGKLIGLEDNAFIVESETLGELRVSSSKFKCSGEGCPPE